MKNRRFLWIVGAGIAALIVVGALVAPDLIRSRWSARSSNPVRRGIARAHELGCFACHGPAGRDGIPDPGFQGGEVPSWSGGVWMMYVENEAEIREFILDGISSRRAASFTALEELERAAIPMPAYKNVLEGSDLDDLTAAFLVLSGMSDPPRDTPEGRGRDLARRWQCFSCHGPGGAGGVENPGSFAGYIPGWYGPDFEELVRDREEFESWIRDGTLKRLATHPVASRFLAAQRVPMPPYPDLTAEELGELWAYVGWLERTEGGIRSGEAAGP
jgi:mono/diheme cytochrome c family protein